MKTRKNMTMDDWVLEDIQKSGINFSEWTKEKWLQDKHSNLALKKEIKLAQDRIKQLQFTLKENESREANTLSFKDVAQKNFFGRFYADCKKMEGDYEKIKSVFNRVQTEYYDMFGERVSRRFLKKKLEVYTNRFILRRK